MTAPSAAASMSSKEIFWHYRQIVKRVNKFSSSMQRQQGLRYVKELFRAGASGSAELSPEKRELLLSTMVHYYNYLKDFESYTDLMQMYRVGQHDTPLQDILRSTAKRVGFDLDMSYDEYRKRRESALQDELRHSVESSTDKQE